MADLSDDEILSELGLEAEPEKKGGRSHEEARIIAGFEDIVRFVDEHGRKPEHGEGKDIFERLYAVRLDRIRGNSAYRTLVADLDKHGLLAGATDDTATEVEDLDPDALLEELGLDDDAPDIAQLKHVRPRAEVKAAEDVADRTKCQDFEKFKPLFAKVQRDLDSGVREARPFGQDASIDPGEFFILGGQMVYVAEAGEEERRTKSERTDRRLRVIYDNGTESDILMRSLQRALHKDEAGRRITDPNAGPLFGNVAGEGDQQSGTIYVLRSLSQHPEIAPHREIIHKIGVTGGEVKTRVSNAELDPTYLFAGVEVVAQYKLFNINRSKLENLLHRFFAAARLDVEIPDRFGRQVKPREWFLVPVSAINEVVERIRDGSISEYIYDVSSASLKKQK
jgi:hypothetical protein